jgi:hypothetical protein
MGIGATRIRLSYIAENEQDKAMVARIMLSNLLSDTSQFQSEMKQ